MRKITKGLPPQRFVDWVRRKPHDKNENQWFSELFQQAQWEIISELSNHNAREQFYLCAYCCDRVSGSKMDTINEHVEARAINPKRSLDYTNIVASCKAKNQCDGSHKHRLLPLTPLMDECESELKFKISGRVDGASQRAIDAIRVLNLGDTEKNNKVLVEKRKQLSHNLLWMNGIDPAEGLEDEALLQDLITDLLTPKNGMLEPFAPVVASILRDWIAA